MRLVELILWTSTFLVSSANSQSLSHRKSLDFGPTLPHASFITSFADLSDLKPHVTQETSNLDPFSVARAFLDNLLKDLDKDHTSYMIRNDSYTDIRTEVSHIYVKQMVDGIEVTNGLININVEDGRVISYGDSVRRPQSGVSHFFLELIWL